MLRLAAIYDVLSASRDSGIKAVDRRCSILYHTFKIPKLVTSNIITSGLENAKFLPPPYVCFFTDSMYESKWHVTISSGLDQLAMM